MIYFNDGEEMDTPIQFLGTVCTIYTDQDPNISGFKVDGFDCSDFTTLYRKGDGYYQLSNDKTKSNEKSETVISKEEYEAQMAQMKNEIEKRKLQEEIYEVKERLKSTDYIIIKQVEGCNMSEYDMEKIKRERQKLRDRINKLQSDLPNGKETQNGKSD